MSSGVTQFHSTRARLHFAGYRHDSAGNAVLDEQFHQQTRNRLQIRRGAEPALRVPQRDRRVEAGRDCRYGDDAGRAAWKDIAQANPRIYWPDMLIWQRSAAAR
jgi:hypothetical protein